MSAQALSLAVAGAGICCAAGGRQACLALLAGEGEAPGPALLDAFDIAGDAIAAVPALPLPAPALLAQRQRELLAAAMADLPEPPAPGERVFVITPESGDEFSALLLMQAAADLLGAHRPLSRHASAFEALRAASAHVAGGAAQALVLACESWLSTEALAQLDDQDQLLGPSSEGVLPGEAAVLLRLGREGPRLDCALALDVQDRCEHPRPLGSPISEALLALPGQPVQHRTVLIDLHAGQRAFSREAEFLRRRHWDHLPPDAPAWRNAAGLGYLGHALPLLQLAALAALPAAQLPAVACARSLWRQALLCARTPRP